MTYVGFDFQRAKVADPVLCDETHERRAPLAISRHKVLSALRHSKELEASAIVYPGDDPQKALKRSRKHHLVDYHERSGGKGATGIPVPTVAAAAIAHEVRQPLAAMVVSANAGLRWLKRSQPNLDEVGAAFERIVRDGHRANEIIASVRAIFGKDRYENARVNVNALIGEVLALVQEELESRRISVRSELSDRVPEVMAERVQLRQVFLNVVMNAIDAMSMVRISCERRLIIKSHFDAHAVTIAVEDSGTGIAPSYIDRIFDPFFTTKLDGMGMGLSICRSIVESHGGRLWFSPRRPHGTTFYVQLPAHSKNHN